MVERGRLAAFFLTLGTVLAGCNTTAATLDLITVARRGVRLIQEDQNRQSAEIVQQLQRQAAALDSAFDADVKLAAAGQIKSADGKPVQLSPEWVISARKGYAAARDLLAEQIRLAEAAHAKQQDNLRTMDESLERASQLIVQQWAIAEQIKQHVLSCQRRLADDR
jgi:hypothetical protein